MGIVYQLSRHYIEKQGCNSFFRIGMAYEVCIVFGD